MFRWDKNLKKNLSEQKPTFTSSINQFKEVNGLTNKNDVTNYKKVSNSTYENMQFFQDITGNTFGIIIREFKIGKDATRPALLIAVSGMVEKTTINVNILAPVFGETQAAKLIYPVESMVRLINVGFIERFDIYGLTIMTVSAFLRLALLHYGASVAISEWFKIKNYRWINWLLGILVIIASLSFFDNVLDFYHFLEKYYFFGIVFTIAILLLCLCVLILTKYKKT